MRARFGSDPTAGSKILSFKFISRYVSRGVIDLPLPEEELALPEAE